ncbi:MAG: AAA family ATPase [Bacteroidota bacterium]
MNLSRLKGQVSLQKIQIQNLFSPIKNIELNNLKDFKEIYILGENGFGKTLILQGIILALKWQEIKRSDNEYKGVLEAYFSKNPTLKLSAVTEDGSKFGSKHSNFLENVFAYGIHRHLHNSSRFADKTGFLTLFKHDIPLLDPIEWLKELDRKEKYESNVSYKEAKDLFVDLFEGTLTINENNKTGEIYFENRNKDKLNLDEIAGGYKNAMIWVSDLVSRLAENQPDTTIKDFVGIVLVDEVGMSLHPKLEKKLVQKLRNWFPKIQWIFTTHSPIVVMAASAEAVFFKIYQEENNGLEETKISEPYTAKELSNLMANSIVTSPLFDLEDARMNSFDESKQELDTSDDYYYTKIHKAMEEKANKVREEGKGYISKQLLNDMLDEAFEDYKK